MTELSTESKSKKNKTGTNICLSLACLKQVYTSNRPAATKELARIGKFCLIGGSGICIDIGGLWLFTEVVGIFYIASAAITSILSVTNNFTWNSLWTFSDRGRGLRLITIFKRWVKYVLSTSFASAIYLGMLTLLTEVFGIYYLISALVAIAIAAPCNFLLSYFWVWKRLPSGGKQTEL